VAVPLLASIEQVAQLLLINRATKHAHVFGVYIKVPWQVNEI